MYIKGSKQTTQYLMTQVFHKMYDFFLQDLRNYYSGFDQEFVGVGLNNSM